MTALFDEVQALRAELEAVKAERDGWRDASFLSDCEARSGQLEEMTVRAESAEARAAQLEAAGAAVLASWDERNAEGPEQFKTNEELGFSYWSPSASMVSSEAMAKLRAALIGREG